MAYLPDLIIDYPNARQYAIEILQRAVKYDIMKQNMADKYVRHIENIDSWQQDVMLLEIVDLQFI